MKNEIVRELIAKTRELANILEVSLGGPEQTHAPLFAQPHGPIKYDPDRDPKPWAARGIEGTRREKDLTCVIMFCRLYAINRREGRGGARRDLRDIAVDAGYSDGRAWNGWVHLTQKDSSGEVWLNRKGHETMLDYAESAGLILPDDLTTWVEPPLSPGGPASSERPRR